MRDDAFRAGLRLADQHAGAVPAPARFTLLDRSWVLLPGVFAPTMTSSTEFFSRALPYPIGGSFLEMGCGAGVTAVWAALAGCARVVATDIAAAAAENTRRNVTLHGVDDRVLVVRGDLFAAVPPNERFDLVFWNAVVIEAPEDYAYTRELDYSFFDQGYSANARFLDEAPGRLTPDGRLLMGSNTLGNQAKLHALAADRGLALTPFTSTRSLAGDIPVEFTLFEVTAA
ncbi:methyltransferase [Catenuloplanes atrovinosus]|uniref:Methylase of polypeptide subunit release factors n=1 Tax=Catenuloplanes atrovinosus TaxID=137266 RepID=A0AAE3YJV8_9ACTN|nr:methyltransferase [Catenuloplanes atrovinosus]MDR7273616.1 methylase of polypeptide subunit release factors [Catenuloplanes atrovinosus]